MCLQKKRQPIVFLGLLAALFTTEMALSQAPSAPGSNASKSARQYLPLPDGSVVTIREGETPEAAWLRAQNMYPEAFGLGPAGDQYDEDYFNSCVLKDLDKAKSDLAVKQLNVVCRSKATPKRCRSVATDTERARCVKSCKEAGYLSNTVGDCSKG